VETLACPSHSWTFAMSASFESAFVAAVARSKCTHSPMTSALMPVSRLYFWRMLRYGSQAPGASPACRCGCFSPDGRGDRLIRSHQAPRRISRGPNTPHQPLRHRVKGNEPGFIALSLDAEVQDALAALHVADAQLTQLFAADAVIEQGSEYGAIPYTLQRVRGRASSKRRACAWPSAGVPSLLLAIGRLTPSTGLPSKALLSQR
jgi:hypothetical protein